MAVAQFRGDLTGHALGNALYALVKALPTYLPLLDADPPELARRLDQMAIAAFKEKE